MQTFPESLSWNAAIAALPAPHLLQTTQWAEVKAQGGWQPLYRIWGDPARPEAAALILVRSISIRGFTPRLRVMYLPKGPLLKNWADSALRQQVLDDLTQLAHREGAIFLKIDPDIPVGSGIPGTPEGRENPLGIAILQEFQARGFLYSREQIQFRNTVLLDLSPSEDEILSRMKQKTRYNIRLAARKGVVVRLGTQADLKMLHRMYAETSLRDGFAIRDVGYYLRLWQTFMAQAEPTCTPLIAEFEGHAIAGLMLFRFARRAYYLHGMSRAIHREKMPTYLLQWEAIKLARASGCTVYDLWGAPEAFAENDPLWGVYRFKEGLGGEVLRTIGAYDLPIRPVFYKLYTQLLPRLLDRMRQRGKAHTQEIIHAQA